MRRFVTLILIAATVMLPASARRTRTGPARVPVASAVSAPSQPSEAERVDTIVAPADSLIRLSGYDKTLRAGVESFFVTNAMADTCSVVAIELTFDYSDMSGRQLHRQTRVVRCDIPSGQTRRLSVPSWDRQHTFYYYLSPAPKRVQATPYVVRSTVERVFVIWSE